MTDPVFKRDCLHFRSDRPCAPHKREGVVCETCTQYAPVRTRILMVKLAAAGDVLRTTSILPALRRKYEGCSLTWITASGSAPLLERNPQIDRIVAFRGFLPPELLVEEFDVIVNLDAAADSAAIASAIRAREKLGYGLDGRGVSYAFNKAAEEWLSMGRRDDLKRANKRTYQDHALVAAELDGPAAPPQLFLTEREVAWGRERGRALGLRLGQRVIGLNTGAGGRWPLKRWTEEGFLATARRFAADGCAVLLLGGPEEVERNQRLAAACAGAKAGGGFVADTGCDNSMREFAALVNLCDAVVTGDTLAMHIATALGKQVVAIFGPTSSVEIDLFGRGEHVTSESMDCLVCYLSHCEKDPNCMNTIAPDRVEAALQRCFAAAEPR
ncbi:MAG: glycosyltransferase family 9 protein [Planctomycetes bacterium]|nr:glycosyltransferase family 9 protein [Planctomycetota bacterium]